MNLRASISALATAVIMTSCLIQSESRMIHRARIISSIDRPSVTISFPAYTGSGHPDERHGWTGEVKAGTNDVVLMDVRNKVQGATKEKAKEIAEDRSFDLPIDCKRSEEIRITREPGEIACCSLKGDGVITFTSGLCPEESSLIPVDPEKPQ